MKKQRLQELAGLTEISVDSGKKKLDALNKTLTARVKSLKVMLVNPANIESGDVHEQLGGIYDTIDTMLDIASKHSKNIIKK